MPSATPVSVLVVDDEESIRGALQKYLAHQQYDVYTAPSGEEALEALRRHRISLMLLDVRMPGINGLDVVPQALEADPDLAILMLTAVNDATSAALCMQRGAMDYLTKPIELVDLSRAVQRALRRRDTLMEDQRLNQQLKDAVATRSAQLRWERQRLERLSTATLDALVNVLEAKDAYFRGHSARVADLAATIAAELKLSDDEVEQTRVAGRLHDIGQIATPEAILNKQGPLTPEEFEQVRQHTVMGARILAPLTHLGPVIAFVRGHHERWNGAGYPDGLTGEAIPIGARVIGAVEVFDALSSARPYREKLTPEDAVRQMAELVETALDPRVHAALAAVIQRRATLEFLDVSAPRSARRATDLY